jgi:hypothetical protein
VSSPRIIVVLVLCLLATACLDETRLNARCEWVGDTSTVAIDMRDGAQRHHLAMDVRVAGENAVRYGDSAKATHGLEGSWRLTLECRDRLYATVMKQHLVSRNDIDVAARIRDFWIDAALVYLPIGLLYFLVASRLAGRIVRNAPPPGERWTMWVHLAWVGLSGSLIAAALAHFHGWNVDWVRLRNGHISFRAAYLPIALYRWQAYGMALAIFAFATWRQFRMAGAGVGSGAPRDGVNRWRQ